jgi:chromosome partitioning protein
VILREALSPIDNEHDIMLIDCPPSLGVLTVNALVASTEVLIPLQAHFFALQGLSKLLDTVTLVRQRINPKLHVGGVVLCMYESATRLAGEVVNDLVKFLEASRGTACAWADARVYQTSIRRNIKLAESCSFGQTVFDYAPRSHGAIDYARLAARS